MAKNYHLQVYQDVIDQKLYETEFNPVFRFMFLKKKLSGLEITLDSRGLGMLSCPMAIGRWIDENIAIPIERGTLELSELKQVSDTQSYLYEYGLKIYIREVIVKNGEEIDNFTEDSKIRNLKP